MTFRPYFRILLILYSGQVELAFITQRYIGKKTLNQITYWDMSRRNEYPKHIRMAHGIETQ